jgi:flagellar biogenesis protein FliO
MSVWEKPLVLLVVLGLCGCTPSVPSSAAAAGPRNTPQGVSGPGSKTAPPPSRQTGGTATSSAIGAAGSETQDRDKTQPETSSDRKEKAKKGLGFGKEGDSDLWALLLKMLAAVIVILVLGGLVIFLIKRVLPRISRPTGKNVSILESVYLGPKKAVHLLEADGRRFLVGCSRDEISMLAELTRGFDQPGCEGET